MKLEEDKYAKSNSVNIENLNKISDGKYTMYYRFTPAKLNPEGAPLLVILHGHGTKSATKFQHEDWNVLAPIDHFGYKQNGSWWLGEKDEFFVARLLQKLIGNIAHTYKCTNNIYIYGSSMGGYGAIYHGILAHARAIYANVPQVKFFPSVYFETFKANAEYIFNTKKTLPIENNLIDMLNDKDDFPVFYLCENICESEEHLVNYLQEHTLDFLNKCYKYQIKAHIEILPQEGYTKNYGIGEVLEKFTRFVPPIKENKCQLVIDLLKNNTTWYNTKDKSIVKHTEELLHINVEYEESTVLYVGSSNGVSNQKKSSKSLIDIAHFSKLYISINIEIPINNEVSLFVQVYNENELESSVAYPLKSGSNTIDIPQFHSSIKYLKILFRSSISKIHRYAVNDIKLNIEKIRDDDKAMLKPTKNSNLLPNIQHIDLNQHSLFQKDEHTYTIEKKGIPFHFYLNYKKGKKLLIALPGATDREKKFYNFQRYTWSCNMDYSFMSVLDPTITEDNDLSIGWFQGKYNQYALDAWIDALKGMLEQNKIDEEDVTFFGSSAGGFASLKLANHFVKSKIIVINPQIYIYRYSANPYKTLLNYSYPDMEQQEVESKYKDRLEVSIDFAKRKAPIYYYQNLSDAHHMQKHFKPYLESISKKIYNVTEVKGTIISNKKLYILHYDDPESGHSPPNKEKTLKFIGDSMNSKIKKGYKWTF